VCASRGLLALTVFLIGPGHSGVVHGANQADVCIGRPADAPAPLVLVSGPVQGASRQIENLQHALVRRHGRVLPVELLTVEERDPAGIARRLDLPRLSGRVAIVTSSGYIAKAVVQIGAPSPLIFATIVEPKSWGIVEELGRRTVNATGVSYAVDLEWKYVELLRLAAPDVRRIGLLADAYVLGRPVVRDILEHAPATLGVQVVAFEAVDRDELEQVFRSRSAREMDAWIVPETPVVFRHEDRVVELVKATRKPHIFGHRRMLDKGVAMTFGADFSSMWDEIADMVDRVCRGVDVRDIPVVRPHHVFFGVSPANARALGLALDPKVYPLATFWQ
jgi:putative tryptophan/tyrosine transport system substrate-binding protein